jgi:iron-sulfur cluster assembly protein
MSVDATTSPILLTERAAQQALKMLEKRGTPAAAIRLGVGTTGCSGLSYKLEFSDAPEEGDRTFESHGVRLVVDPKSYLYMAGTQVDYVTQQFKSGFTFTNPNEKSRCGCGESFAV